MVTTCFITYLYRSSEILANCLTSFQELMDHGDVSWDVLTNGFIKHVMFLPCVLKVLTKIKIDYSKNNVQLVLAHSSNLPISFVNEDHERSTA